MAIMAAGQTGTDRGRETLWPPKAAVSDWPVGYENAQ